MCFYDLHECLHTVEFMESKKELEHAGWREKDPASDNTVFMGLVGFFSLSTWPLNH